MTIHARRGDSKPATRPVSHELDVYGCWVHLCISRRAWAVLRRTIKSLDQHPPEAAGAVTTVQHESPRPVRYTKHYVVWIDLAAAHDDRDLVDTVAHEAAHVATSLLDDVGQRLAPDEALTYLVGWVAGWIWEGCGR